MVPRRGRRGRTIALVTAVVALVVGTCIVLAAWAPFDDPGHPSSWDPRVVPLVEVVEDHTERRFEHPVELRFEDDATFEEGVRADEEDLDDEDRKEIADTEALGRALGLFAGSTDLFDETNDLRGSGILAYYSYDDQEMVVRLPEGTSEDDIVTSDDLPVNLRATIVHELTHALQDQLYDLAAIQEDAADDDNRRPAVRALIEGHASWIEDAYVREDLDPDEQAEREDEADSESSEVDEETQDVAEALIASQAFPYVAGPALTGALMADGGPDAVDDAFGSPPVAEDQILSPSGYIGDDDQEGVDTPEDVATPAAPDGTEEIDSGHIGAPTLALMLATAIPDPDAVGAALGWGNDAYVSYRDDDTVCVLVSVVGDDQQTTDAIAAGLRAWADSRPSGSHASSRTSDGVAEVTVCDPGPDADQPLPDRTSIQQLFGRSGDLDNLITEEGMSVERSECLVDGLYTQLSIEELSGDEPTPEVETIVQGLLLAC